MPEKRTIPRTCKQCGKDFLALGSQVKQGRALYCSRECQYLGRRKRVTRTCEQCGEAFEVRPCHLLPGRSRFCSAVCWGASKKGRSINFKGGRYMSGGYVMVLPPDGKVGDRFYAKEHRLVAERMLCRPLTPDEVVHHINENKADNRPENLQVMTRAEHLNLHQSGKRHGGKPIMRWARKHDACIRCGTTAIRHAGFGLCAHCRSSDRWRDWDAIHK